jgi:glutamine synthetase adenylyltransferase
MSRPKKTKINLDKNSLQELMQEIYNDCSNIMNSARREINERKVRVTIADVNDEYQIGKVNNETLKILETTIDKKIALAKLQSQILGNKSNEDDGNNVGNGITEEDKNILRELFKEKSGNKNTKYDID